MRIRDQTLYLFTYFIGVVLLLLLLVACLAVAGLSGFAFGKLITIIINFLGV